MKLILNESTPSVKVLKSLHQKIIKAVQQVYDLWEQDEDEGDPELGFGGICDLIAEEIISVLDKSNIEAVSMNSEGMGENHTWVVAKFREGVFMIDIPPEVYESGGGYFWKKKKGVNFHPEMISLEKIRSDPEEFYEFLE